MSRKVAARGLSALSQLVTIIAGEPGPGGASHSYQIQVGEHYVASLQFQCGTVPSGINGVPDEALYAILIDRLRAFQAGPCKCFENAEALSHLELALAALNSRTAERQLRGVEGEMKQ